MKSYNKHGACKHPDFYPKGDKRSFTYDDAGKLLSATENEEHCGSYTYNYEYDKMGNRTAVIKTNKDGMVVERERYIYNKSNQLVCKTYQVGRKTARVKYTYDKDGNLISEVGCDGSGKVSTFYRYTVENRLEAVYEGGQLLMAASYDGDGNRVFQLNYNPERGLAHLGDCVRDGKSGKYGKDDRCSVWFPIREEISDTEIHLISLIQCRGREENYELTEYINDVNREYAEVLVEQTISGRTDTSYVYGADRLSFDTHYGSSGYYLYDPRGSVTGITNKKGQIYQSYRYNAFGEITFGEPKYDNEYTYNGESYNPNIESQYLRARYYNVTLAAFITEDSYLGDITSPLTLNRYNYCVSSPLNYVDPSGHWNDDIELDDSPKPSRAESLSEDISDRLEKEVLDAIAYMEENEGSTYGDYIEEKVYLREKEKEEFIEDAIEWWTTDSVGSSIASIHHAVLTPVTALVVTVRNLNMQLTEGYCGNQWSDIVEVNNNIVGGLGESLYTTGQYLYDPMNLWYTGAYIAMNSSETIFADPFEQVLLVYDSFWKGDNKTAPKAVGKTVMDVAQAAVVASAVKGCGIDGVSGKPSAGVATGANGINRFNGLPENQGYSSFGQLKNVIGSAGEGKHWHHIVEQSQITKSGFSAQQIHNTSNIIAIDQATHAKITGYYNTTTFRFTGGQSVRDWLAGQSYEYQYEFGLDVLRKYGVIE